MAASAAIGGNGVVTIQDYLDQPPVPVQFQVLPRPEVQIPWGNGTVLGGEKTYSARPLPSQDEAIVRARLEVLKISGKEQMLKDLFLDLTKSSLKKDQVGEWIKSFQKLKSDEEKAFALAILIVRHLRPAKVLSQIESDCKDILESLLSSAVNIDDFIFECEVGLMVEKIDEKLKVSAEVLATTERETVAAATEIVDGRIQEAFASIKKELLALQEFQEKIHALARADIKSLDKEVNAMKDELLKRIEEADKLTEKDAAREAKLSILIKECQELLGRI